MPRRATQIAAARLAASIARREGSAGRERGAQRAAEAVARTRGVDRGDWLGRPCAVPLGRPPAHAFRPERDHGRARAGGNKPLERRLRIRGAGEGLRPRPGSRRPRRRAARGSAAGQRTGAGFSSVRTPAARAAASTARVVAKERLPCIISQSPGTAPARAAVAMLRRHASRRRARSRRWCSRRPAPRRSATGRWVRRPESGVEASSPSAAKLGRRPVPVPVAAQRRDQPDVAADSAAQPRPGSPPCPRARGACRSRSGSLPGAGKRSTARIRSIVQLPTTWMVMARPPGRAGPAAPRSRRQRRGGPGHLRR